MSTLFNDILTDCSFVLIETAVNTTLGTAVAPGVQTATPPSMAAIYAGATLIVGTGSTQELIAVISTTSTTFTANFANPHPSTDPLVGATFPSGQPDAPLFTQPEMLDYLSEVQNDFLLKVRPIYVIDDLDISTGTRVYAQPSDAIRLERISYESGAESAEGYGTGPYGQIPYGGGQEAEPGEIIDLYETSQSRLDLQNPYWQTEEGEPAQWFRDQIDTGNFGIYPLPTTNDSVEVWYSQRAAETGNTLLTTLLVPDVFSHALKYGTLARCFSKDGEFRDVDRATYCQKRYDLIVLLAKKFMDGAGLRMSRGATGDPAFSPMPVKAGAV